MASGCEAAISHVVCTSCCRDVDVFPRSNCVHSTEEMPKCTTDLSTCSLLVSHWQFCFRNANLIVLIIHFREFVKTEEPNYSHFRVRQKYLRFFQGSNFIKMSIFPPTVNRTMKVYNINTKL
jgi:hypothetical protein